MGSWDLGSFDNDDALDWANEVVEEGDLESIASALDRIVTGQRADRDANASAVAVAAAEIVAAIHGKPAKRLPDDLKEWLAENKFAADDELVSDARRAVKLVAEDSELRDLWGESSDFDRWKAMIIDLMRRLA